MRSSFSDLLRRAVNNTGSLTDQMHTVFSRSEHWNVRLDYASRRDISRERKMAMLETETNVHVIEALLKGLDAEAFLYVLRRDPALVASLRVGAMYAKAEPEVALKVLEGYVEAFGGGFKNMLDASLVDFKKLAKCPEARALLIEKVPGSRLREVLSLVESELERDMFARRLASLNPSEANVLVWFRVAHEVEPGSLPPARLVKALRRFPSDILSDGLREMLQWWLEPKPVTGVQGPELQKFLREISIKSETLRQSLVEFSSFEEVKNWFASTPAGVSHSLQARTPVLRWLSRTAHLSPDEAVFLLQRSAVPQHKLEELIFSKVDPVALMEHSPSVACQYASEVLKVGGPLRSFGAYPALSVIQHHRGAGGVLARILEASTDVQTVEVLLDSFNGSFDEFIAAVSTLGPEA